jgi:hypothetical protein
VEEDDRLVTANTTAADVVDETGHRFTGVRRVEQDTFRAGQQIDRFAAFGRLGAVGRSDIVVADIDVGSRQPMRQTQ